MTRPPLLAFALVGAGGAIGTALRYLASEAVPDGAASVPSTASLLVILAINVLGSGLLGALVGRLGRHPRSAHPSAAAPRGRLLPGTGVLGGFTTYSTFALDVVELARAGQWLGAIGYPIASVALGLGAAWCGLRFGRGQAFAPHGGTA